MSTDSKAEYSLQTSATTSIKHIEHVQVKVNRICAEIVITPYLIPLNFLVHLIYTSYGSVPIMSKGKSWVPSLLDSHARIANWWRGVAGGGESRIYVDGGVRVGGRLSYHSQTLDLNQMLQKLSKKVKGKGHKLF